MAADSLQDVRGIDRRTFLKSGVAAGTVVSLAGCAGGSEDGGTTTATGDEGGGGAAEGELHIVTGETNPEAKAWFDKMAQDFMEETGTGVIIDYSGLSPTQRIATLIQTGNTPDLATLDSGQAAQLATQDQLAPVDDIISTAESEYNGSIPNNVRLIFDDNNYLVPLWTNPTQIWYWGDVYEEYGLEQSAGIMWDEYLEIAEEISNAGDRYGTVVPSGSTTLTAFTFWNFLVSNGGQVATREEGEVKIALDQSDFKQRAVETAEFLNQLHQYSPEASDFQWGDILQSYVSRNGAHCIYGPRAKLQVINNRPELSEQSRPHFPVYKEEQTFINNGGGFTLFQGSPNKEAAREFLRFILRENRLIEFLTSVAPVHNFPTIDSIPEMDQYRNNEFIQQNFSQQDLQVVAESFEKGVSWGGETEPYNPYGPSLFTSKHLGTLLYNVNIQGKDPQQAVEDTAGRLRNTLSELTD